jgi:hypothetical protein
MNRPISTTADLRAFDNWMLRIQNKYYYRSGLMVAAYSRITPLKYREL